MLVAIRNDKTGIMKGEMQLALNAALGELFDKPRARKAD
jgi:hypothetical protein